MNEREPLVPAASVEAPEEITPDVQSSLDTIRTEEEGLVVEDAVEAVDNHRDNFVPDIETSLQILNEKLATIKRYEYGPNGELLHEPTADEKTILQKGRSLSGQLRIVSNQLDQVSLGASQANPEVLVARAVALQKEVEELLVAPAAPKESESPLILGAEYRVADGEVVTPVETVQSEVPVALVEPEVVAAEITPQPEGQIVRIESLYQKEREDLQRQVDELFARETLPEPVAGMLRVVKTDMLTRLSLLQIRDPQYMPLRDLIKENISRAEALLGNTKPAGIPVIEGVPNPYLAPRFEKLGNNHRFKAALLVALLAAVTPGKVSDTQYAEAGLGTLPTKAVTGIGRTAAWGTATPASPESVVTKLTVKEVIDDVPPAIEKITVMPPLPEVMEAPLIETTELPDDVAPVPLLEVPEMTDTAVDAASDIDTAVPTVAESLPDRYTGLVQHGQVETYPDNQLEKFFATVDTKNLPTAFVDRLKAQTKTAFYADAEALRAAGFSTNDANVVFDGEKLNYEQPVEQFTSAVVSALDLLAAPHTEVVESGSDLTNTILESYASDLTMVPAGDRASLVAEALAAYEANDPDARATLRIDSPGDILADSIVDLRPLAPYLSAAVADYVRREANETEGSEVVDTDTALDESASTERAEVVSLTPETYPGGELAFSRDYQTLLASLGITQTAGSWYDAMFAPQTPSNKAILDETVGDVTKLMISQSPAERSATLSDLQVAEATAKRVYDVIVAERAAGRLPASLDTDTSVATVLRNYVLQAAAQNI